MFKKIFSIVLFSYSVLLVPYTILSSDDNLELSYFVKNIAQELITAIFKYGYDGKLFINIDKDVPSNKIDNKIDIIISNHYLGSVDIMLIIIILHHYKIYSYNFLYNKDTYKYIPGIGLILKSSHDIPIEQNINIDSMTIKNKTLEMDSKYHKHFIIIFPEGPIYNYSYKKLSSKDYAKENKIHLNNLLIPKAKGLYCLINQLQLQNKLGSIWDFTVNHNKNDYYVRIRKLYIDNFKNYLHFKKYIYNLWKKKDKLLDNYDAIKYKQIYIKNNYYFFILIIFIICCQTIILTKIKYLVLFILRILYHYIF